MTTTQRTLKVPAHSLGPYAIEACFLLCVILPSASRPTGRQYTDTKCSTLDRSPCPSLIHPVSLLTALLNRSERVKTKANGIKTQHDKYTNAMQWQMSVNPNIVLRIDDQAPWTSIHIAADTIKAKHLVPRMASQFLGRFQ